MMRDIINKIEEALKPSQYRAVVKGWDKERYADIFKDDNFEHDKNGYRVFIPIGAPSRNVQSITAPPELTKVLADAGFEIQDYVKGIVFNKEKKQSIKLGKVLTKLKRDDLLQKFNNDSRREGTKNQYIVVISRHPYDIAGMSTDRGWTSCMNLKNGINRHYVPLDVKHGSLVAYVTTTDDKNLNNPSGRVLIKPFYDTYSSDEKVYFGIEDRVYGTNVPGFVDVVNNWVKMVNTKYQGLDGIAMVELHSDLYADSSRRKVMSGDGNGAEGLTDYLKKNPKQLGNIIADLDFPSIYEVRAEEKEVVLEAWRDMSRFASDIGFDMLEKFADIQESIKDGDFSDRFIDKDAAIQTFKASIDDYEEVLRYLTEADLQKIARDLGIDGDVNEYRTIKAIAEEMPKSKYDEDMRKAMVEASVLTNAPSEEDIKTTKDILFSSLYGGFPSSNLWFAEGENGEILAKMRLRDFIDGIVSVMDEDEDDYNDDKYFFQAAKGSYGGWFVNFDTYNVDEYLKYSLDDEQKEVWNKVSPLLDDDYTFDGETSFDEKTAANIFTRQMIYNESLHHILKLSSIIKG
jgi:hypothetical protein